MEPTWGGGGASVDVKFPVGVWRPPGVGPDIDRYILVCWHTLHYYVIFIATYDHTFSVVFGCMIT